MCTATRLMPSPPPPQPLPTVATQTYLVTNQPNVSVGCADIYGDGKGSQLGVAVLIHTASGASGYVPQQLQLLLKRTPGSLRTTISDMYVALFNDDTSTGHAPGTVVSGGRGCCRRALSFRPHSCPRPLAVRHVFQRRRRPLHDRAGRARQRALAARRRARRLLLAPLLPRLCARRARTNG